MSDYSDEEFISLFNQLYSMRTTIADMRTLKPEFIQKIYYHFLKDFGVNLENINQFPFTVSEAVSQHPDLFREASRTMTLAKVINLFFKTIYNEDTFMPTDLFDPKPKRTRRYFQMIVDFYSEVNNYCDAVTEIEDQVKLKVEGRAKMLESIEEFKRKNVNLRQQNTKYQIQGEEIHKHITAAQSELSESHVIKESLKNKLDKLKLENSNTATAINDVKLQIIEGKERIENLSGQVVQESEKYDIEERERQLSTYRDSNSQKMSRMDELKKSMKTLNTANKLMKDNLLALMREIKEVKEKESEYNNFISQMEREKAADLEEVEDLQMKLQQLQEQIVSRQERISQVHLAWTVKKESLHNEVNQNKLALDEIRRSQSEDEIAAQDLESELIQVEKDIAAIKEQMRHYDHFVATKYQAVLQAMEAQKNDLEVILTDLCENVSRVKEI